MHESSRHPNIVVRFEGWDDIQLLDDRIVPALRDGSTRTVRVIIDEALLLACHTLNLNDPHYTIFHSWGYAITSLHVERPVTNDLRIDTIGLFYALADMPSLVELTIHLHYLEHLAPVTETANIPFRLGRLELHPVFRGWPRLLAQSGETLTDLVLGRPDVVQDQAFLKPNDYGRIRSVTTLRLDNLFDTAFLYACVKLRNLELNTQATGIGRRLGVGPITRCIAAAPRTLQNLILGFRPSQIGLAFWDVIDLLNSRPPALAALRCLTVQACYNGLGGFQDMLEIDDRGRAARAILEDVCRRRRVALSIH